MKALVIGGTLFIGKALVRKLEARGYDVAILSRSSGIRADRNDPDEVRRALDGLRFDVVFDNVYDWERGTTADQVAATAEACRHDGLRRYVFMSSVAAYGEEGEHVRYEDSPLAPDDYRLLYSRHKAMSERALFAMPGLPVATLRPPFVYGPNNPFHREAFFWERLGQRILIPGRGERKMQFIHVEDLAEIAILAAESPEAEGLGFNAANPDAVTQEEFVDALAVAAGGKFEKVFVPREELPAGAFGEYLDLPPIPQDTTRVRSVLGFAPRAFSEGLRQTYQWWNSK